MCKLTIVWCIRKRDAIWHCLYNIKMVDGWLYTLAHYVLILIEHQIIITYVIVVLDDRNLNTSNITSQQVLRWLIHCGSFIFWYCGCCGNNHFNRYMSTKTQLLYSSDNIKQDINKNVYSELSAYDALLE